MKSISPDDLAEAIAAGKAFSLVDVREPWEFEICKIAGSVNIPLGTLPVRWNEIDASRPVVAICHHGMRSMHACQYLEASGISDPINLTGGIDAWAEDVDETLDRY